MTVKQVSQYLESIAPLSLQESYDNAGLIVGNPKTEVTGVLCCLDSTEEIIDEAIEKGCNLVVAHHPIVFGGLKKLNGKNYIERTVIKAIKNDIAIYAIHTNLDNVYKQGVNQRISEQLGLTNLKILSPKKGLLKKLFTFCPSKNADEIQQAMFNAGAGHIGNYDSCSFNIEGFGTFRGGENTNPHVGKKGELHKEGETKIEVVFPAYLQGKIVSALLNAHPYEEVAYDIISLENKHLQVGSGMFGELETELDEVSFLQLLKDKMQAKCVRHTALRSKKIKKVAVCGGSGSFLLNNAIGAGADVFVTADYKYHQFFDADNQIVIADIGHYESEQFTINLLSEILSQKFANFAVFSTERNTNPVNYF